MLVLDFMDFPSKSMFTLKERFLLEDDGNILECDSGDGCTML